MVFQARHASGISKPHRLSKEFLELLRVLLTLLAWLDAQPEHVMCC